MATDSLLLLDTESEEGERAEHTPPAGERADLGIRDVFGGRIGLGDGNFHHAIAALMDLPVDVIFEFVGVQPILVNGDASTEIMSLC